MINLLSRFRRQSPAATVAEVVSQPDSFLDAIGQERTRLRQHLPLDSEVNDLADQAPRVLTSDIVDLDWVARAFAVVDAAANRSLGVTFRSVQFLAGLALFDRAIAEMQTGEGKTFTAALPAFVFSLAERGVHVMTSNAYLAERDASQLTPLYNALGLTVGLLTQNASLEERREAYRSDLTYGPGYEFAFDYLRDEIQKRSHPSPELGDRFLSKIRGRSPYVRLRHRSLAFAIVDEIDHVLLDEATSPLVISDSPNQPADDARIWQLANHFAERCRVNHEYTLDQERSLVAITDAGRSVANKVLERIPTYLLLRPWLQYIEQCLKAKELLQRDVHYVISDGRLNLVDQSTGRIFDDRQWQDGLHQAVEANEGLDITRESRGLARITRQRFFAKYDNLCGMTGTAMENADEFAQVYRLPVVSIPTWKASRRRLLASRVFADSESRWKAVVEEVARRNARKQPVLVGTRSIEASRKIAGLLEQHGLAFQLLNGLQDRAEAEIIAGAGKLGAITVATNMAGRGTDIRIDSEVYKLGGLHVIGTEHHNERRIDRQLIGRAARQGDPGSAVFFLSAEDELVTSAPFPFHELIAADLDDHKKSKREHSADILKAQQGLESQSRQNRRLLAEQDDEQSQWSEEFMSQSA